MPGVPLSPRAGKPPPEEEERANPHTLMAPHGNEGPKINRAKAQVRDWSVGILRLGALSACQRLYRAPRFSAALASHQQPWEESSVLPKLSLFPSGARLQRCQLGGQHRPAPRGCKRFLPERAWGQGFEGRGPQIWNQSPKRI